MTAWAIGWTAPMTIDEMIPKVTVPEGTCGPWTVKRFSTVEISTAQKLRFEMAGRGIAEGDYTQLLHRTRGVVMSDTPAERRDHLDFVWNATGQVLIAGLGLGMCLQAILLKLYVTEVTVIEIDPDLIELVGSHYTDRRVKIVHDDIFEWKPPSGVRYGACWFDVWDTMCGDNVPQMHRLHRRFVNKCDWYGSWGHQQSKAANRRPYVRF